VRHFEFNEYVWPVVDLWAKEAGFKMIREEKTDVTSRWGSG
jgi:hypothetical protein